MYIYIKKKASRDIYGTYGTATNSNNPMHVITPYT